MANDNNLTGDFKHCVMKHTLNGDGFFGAQGDAATLKCIVDRWAERTTNDITNQKNSNSGNSSRKYEGSVSSRTRGSTITSGGGRR